MDTRKNYCRYFGAIAVGAFCLIAYYVGYSATPFRSQVGQNPTNRDIRPALREVSGLAIKSESLDIGEVYEERDFEWKLPIQNRTSKPMKVFGFVASCGCLGSFEPKEFPLEPMQTQIVKFKLDLTHRGLHEVGMARREFQHNLIPITQSGLARGQGWQLQGVVKSRMTFDCASFHFGDATGESNRARVHTVTAKILIPTRDVRFRCEPDLVEVRALTKKWTSDNLLESCVFEICPKLTNPVGKFNCDLVAELIDHTEKPIPGGRLSIAGDVQTEFRVFPARVLLGAVPVGDTVTADVCFQAPPNVEWKIDHIETDSSDVEVNQAKPNGGPQTFHVVVHVREIGHQVRNVRFILNKASLAHEPVNVEVLFHGLAANKPMVGERRPKP